MSKTTTFMLSVFLTATSTVSSGSSAAGTASLYVAKHGNDAHTCSQAANPATPKLTISAALDCFGSDPGAAANKVVEVAAGTYAENLNRFWEWPKGSSWSAPFTLRGKPGETVTVQPSSGNRAAYFHDQDKNIPFYVVIKGITFDGRNVSEAVIGSFAPFIRYDGIRITNVIGMGIQGGASNLEILNSHFDTGPLGLHIDAAHAGGQYAYPFYLGGNNILFDGNLIEDFPTFGLHMYNGWNCSGVHGHVIRNNIIRNFGWGQYCGTKNADPRCNGRGSDDKGDAIVLCGTGHKVYNNLIYNGNSAINLYTDGNSEAHQNTIYNMNLRGIISNVPTGNKVNSNIVYNPTPPRDGNIFSWQNPDTTTYSNNLCGQSGGGCSLGVNPLFVDPTNGNFNLQSGSPAAGIGSTLY